MKAIEMTMDEWEERFLPQKNIYNDDAAGVYNGDKEQVYGMYDYIGKDIKKVWATDEKKVWTVVESSECGDDNKWYIIPGYHLVNRIGYFICKKKWSKKYLQTEIIWD